MLSLMVAMVVASTAQWSCEDEDVRVTLHLEDALTQLQTVTPQGLSEEQRSNRAHALRDLRRYIDEKQFPRNMGEATPVFVDAAERHCAMGALIAWNGGREIVRHIRATRNLATVPTLVDEPGLAQWLELNGMTVEEAALVQPTYYVCTPSIDVCRRRGDAEPRWYASGSFPPDGGYEPSRPATEDGVCAGAQNAPSLRALAPNVIVEEPSGLVRSSTAFLHASWAQCRDPLRISEASLNEGTVEGCMRAMVAADPRAILPSCGNDYDSRQIRRCADDGRFFAAMLPREGVAAALNGYFNRFNLDAGLPPLDFASIERSAWSHADDGGTVPAGDVVQLLTWKGSNAETCVLLSDGGVENQVPDAGTAFDAGTRIDAGSPVDAGASVDAGSFVDAGTAVDAGVNQNEPPRGCSTGMGLMVALSALLLKSRRGQR